MEEIHFKACHSGNLLPIVACCVSTGSVPALQQQSTTDVRIQKCCVRIVLRILTTDP